MILLKTAGELARILSRPPDPEIQSLLQVQVDRLAEYYNYAFEELAEILIVEPDDALEIINTALGWALLDGETFARPVELIALHEKWIEATFILSDDGFGLVLFVSINEATDRMLLTACKRALIECEAPDFP